MLIVCPNCATSYRVEPSSLGAAGRSVRCVRCRSVWLVNDPSALAAVTESYRSDVLTILQASPTGGQDGADTWLDAAPDMPADPMPAEQTQDPAEVPPPEWAPTDAPAEDAPLVPVLPEHGMIRPHHPVDVPPGPTFEPIDPMAPLADATVGGDIETLAARKAKRDARRRLRLAIPGLPTTIMALIAINTILIGWRADVVKVLPQTASLYAAIGMPVNLRGLKFTQVTTVTETLDGVPVLVVEGTIASASNHVVEIPRLRFAVRNPRGQEIYSWTALPTRSVLAPGETLTFRSRLASPPPETNDIAVRFFNRRDRMASIQ